MIGAREFDEGGVETAACIGPSVLRDSRSWKGVVACPAKCKGPLEASE